MKANPEIRHLRGSGPPMRQVAVIRLRWTRDREYLYLADRFTTVPPGWPAVIEIPAVPEGRQPWLAVGVVHRLRQALADASCVDIRGEAYAVMALERQLDERWPW